MARSDRLLGALELRIPPPAVLLFIAAAMWGISRADPSIDVSRLVRATFAIALALAGGGIALSGVIAFRRAKTTVNPMKPETATSLVTLGIYRFTRNPMYVGLLFVLIGWAVFLASSWGLAGPVVFVLYMNCFQIVPEEKVLAAMFGTDYAKYKTKVRRWL